MSDKKLIDDYYSQNQESASEPKKTPKASAPKIKGVIKGKIKPKVTEKKPEKTDEKKIKPSSTPSKQEPVFKKPFEKTPVEKKPVQTKKASPSLSNNENNHDNEISEKKERVKTFKSKEKTNFSQKKDMSDDAPRRAFKKDRNKKYSKNFSFEDEDTSFTRSTKIKHEKKQEKNIEDIVQNLTDRTGETVIISDILSVKELSEKTGIPLIKLITEFMKNGMKVTINSKVDFETASIICDVFKIKLQKDISSGFGVEEMLSGDISSLLQEDDSSVLEKRAPVVSIMGHVDHGKTSLLDYLRQTKVVDKEAGGITQSIGAYQVSSNGEKITFLDTPGHEAFTIMRARGAKSTDIAILVVASDEGVKPQTIESINHAKEAGLKIIVAMTKIDKPGANLDNVKSGLSSHGLLAEDWGGDTPMVGVSSKTGEGIDELLEMILLISELEDFKANPNRQAIATILESNLDTKLGPVSTLLINTGTLQKGDSIVCKGSYGKVKVLKSDQGKNIDSALPSAPVLVVGLDKVCEGGDIVQVVSDVEKARLKALEYNELMASKKATSTSSIDLIMAKIRSGNLKQLKIVLKADTNGSLEAIKNALLNLSTPETQVTIIHSGVGSITQGDVVMCQGSSAVLIGFNVETLGNTKNIIEDTKIEFISSKVIYHITERIEKIISGMLDPKEVEIPLGEAEVGGIFYEGDGFMILGLKIKDGNKIENKAKVRILSKDKYLGEGEIENLKSGIIDVGDLEGPVECGIRLKTNIKVELKNTLEIFKIEIQK